jgi:hypothetical protein
MCWLKETDSTLIKFHGKPYDNGEELNHSHHYSLIHIRGLHIKKKVEAEGLEQFFKVALYKHCVFNLENTE